MLAAAKSIVKRQLLDRGHYMQQLRRRSFPGVAVLCYHGVCADSQPVKSIAIPSLHVTASEFEAHCRIINQLCDPISLQQWRTGMLPERPVLITFDDGYRSVFTQAKPILQMYKIPAVVFACTGPVERSKLLWHDAVARIAGEKRLQECKTYDFKRWSQLRKESEQYVDRADPNALMTRKEIEEISRTPGFEIGSHTVDHPILANLDCQHQSEQILANRHALETWTGRQVTTFAYPNGQPAIDYNADTLNILRKNAFDFAFTTEHGFASRCGSLELSRFFMLRGVSSQELAHRLCYSWSQ